MMRTLKDSIRARVRQSWRDEGVEPHEDDVEFIQHVDDVHAHARKHKIKDGRKALESYTDSIRDSYIANSNKRLH